MANMPSLSASTVSASTTIGCGSIHAPCSQSGTVPIGVSTKSKLQEYCEGQLDAIRRINGIESLHTPASFVVIAAFIGYLSRLAYGNNSKNDPDAQFYIRFVNDVLGNIKHDYKAIASDLYYVFRCGLVHAYSFCPPIDAPAPTYHIAISHSIATKWNNGFHLATRKGVQYTVLNADDLILDLFKAIEFMFNDPILGPHAIKFGTVQPPIQSI